MTTKKANIMKKLLLLTTFLVSMSTYAHDHTRQDKKVVYKFIQKQLDKGEISVKTAQKMWADYIRCCK